MSDHTTTHRGEPVGPRDNIPRAHDGDAAQRTLTYARGLLAAGLAGDRELAAFVGAGGHWDEDIYPYAFGCAIATIGELCDALERLMAEQGQSGTEGSDG